MTKWEYKIVILPGEGIRRVRPPEEAEDTLNELGREGWEVVSVTTSSVGFGSTADFVWLCKRPLEEE